MADKLLLLEDLFKITAVDPDGKKFDRVSRIKATGENMGMDLILDVNIEVYPLALGDRLNIALAKTLNLDGTPSDEGSYRPDATGPSLADNYEYVMYGRLFKFENTSNTNKMAVYISYGGLMMRLEADSKHLKGLTTGQNIYLLAPYAIIRVSKRTPFTICMYTNLRRNRGPAMESARTGYAYDGGMLAHRDPEEASHPETPERLVSIMEGFRAAGFLSRAKRIAMGYEDVFDIPQVHSTAYHERMLRTSEMETDELCELAKEFDSIYLCKETARSALMAVGSTVALAKAIARGTVENGFAVVRPPGHHAEHNHPMGFCIYNNVAVAAKSLLGASLGVQRILVLDWDVHHGNGTQNTFIDDPNVLFISLHRHDNGKFYPHNSLADMHTVGSGPAAGRNINIPWPHAGFGDAEYLYAFSRVVLPVAMEFDPDFVFVSAGFDAAIGDPIGGCLVTPEGFAHMTHLLKGLAGGKLLLALEGGYNVEAVARSSEACMRILLGETPPRLPRPAPPTASCINVIERVVQVQSPFWKCLAPRHHVAPSTAKTIGLGDLLETHWAAVCKDKLDLLPLPILEEDLSKHFSGRVHLSEDILECTGTILLCAHETDTILHTAIESNVLGPNSANVIQPAFQSTIEAAMKSGAAIIDINFPARVWKLKQTSTGTPEELTAYNNLFIYLWDTFIAPSKAKSVIIISNGIANYAVGKLIDCRPVEDRLETAILLSSTLFLPIVTAGKASWYQKHSKVYVPGSDKPLGTPIPTGNVYGCCFAAAPEGPLQSLNTALGIEPELLKLFNKTK